MIKLRTLIILMLTGLVVACSTAEERAAKYIERAEASFEAGDLVKSELDAKNTLQIEPQNVQARLLLARIAETKILSDPDAWRSMMSNLQRVIELQPDNIEARTKLIQLYMRFLASAEKEEVLGRIREELDAATGYAPNDEKVVALTPIVEYHEAVVAADNQAKARALSVSETLFRKNPKDLLVTSFLTGVYSATDPDRALAYLDDSMAAQNQPALRILKIGILQKQQRMGDAEIEYLKLIEENPKNTQLRYGLAKFYADSGRNDEAEKLLMTIAEDNPDDTDTRVRLVKFVAQNQGLPAAQDLVKTYISESPETWEYHFLLGDLLLGEKKLDEAEAIYLNVIEKNGVTEPGLDARNRLARLRMAQQRKSEAQEYIDAVLAEDAANSNALMMQAALLIERGDTDGAIAGLRTVLRNDPTSKDALLIMARAHSLAGNGNLAKESYQRLVAAHPDNADGRRELARLLMQDRQWEEARALLLLGVKRYPQDLEMTRMLVDTLVRVNDWEAAQVQADRIIETEETRALGHYLQGRIYQASGKIAESVESFKIAIDLEPKAIEPLTNLVRSYVQLDRVKEARTYIEGFQAANPDNVHSQTLLAEVNARLGDFKQAIIENDKALELNPRWVPAYRNLIGLHLLQGDLGAAEKAADGALEVMPDNADLRLLRATVYERQSRWDEAITIYEAELNRNPKLDIAANNFAALVADHRMDEATMGRALQAVQRFRNTDNPIFLDTLGWVLYRTGDIEEAVKALEKAVAGAGQVPQLHYHLGMAYFALDRLDVAKRELQAAVVAGQPYTGLDQARETLELL